MGSLIELKRISKSFGQMPNITRALSDVSFAVEKGESLAIIGPSGCGKTTLLNTLGLLIQPNSGEYQYQGQSVAEWSDRCRSDFRNRQIGFIVQDFALLENETALENVLLPLLYAKNHPSRNQRKKLAQQQLDRVGMGSQSRQIVRTLSGGQRQRIAIARAIINQPEVILADEPTGALDINNQEQIVRILMDLVDEGKTLIMATHNLELASRCSRTIKILDGRIADAALAEGKE